MPLTASHSPLLTLHMLWVDLSKCFITFSRAVGQLLQARRGVPAQVRKAVWNLYSRPHGSLDSAFFQLPHTLGAYAAPCGRSLALTTRILRCRHVQVRTYLYFSAKSTQRTPQPMVQGGVGYSVQDSRDASLSEVRRRMRGHCGC